MQYLVEFSLPGDSGQSEKETEEAGDEEGMESTGVPPGVAEGKCSIFSRLTYHS